MNPNNTKAEIGLSLAAIVLFVAAIITARQWPLETALFPYLLSIAGLGLAALALIGDLFSSKIQTLDEPATIVEEVKTPQSVTFLWIAGFFAAVMVFGYQWGLTAMALAFYRFEARLSWTIAGLAAAGSAMFLYIAIRVLNIPLYEGALLEYLT